MDNRERDTLTKSKVFNQSVLMRIGYRRNTRGDWVPKGQLSEDECDEVATDVHNESTDYEDMGFHIEADMVNSTPAHVSSLCAISHGLVSPPRAPYPSHGFSHHSTPAPLSSVESHLERLETEVRSIREDQQCFFMSQ